MLKIVKCLIVQLIQQKHGGVIGLNDGSEMIIENCESLNNSIESTGTSGGNAGGIIGESNVYKLKVSKCNSTNNKLTTNNCVGGIVGLSRNSIEISECNVDKGSIETNRSGLYWASGIMGYRLWWSNKKL